MIKYFFRKGNPCGLPFLGKGYTLTPRINLGKGQALTLHIVITGIQPPSCLRQDKRGQATFGKELSWSYLFK